MTYGGSWPFTELELQYLQGPLGVRPHRQTAVNSPPPFLKSSVACIVNCLNCDAIDHFVFRYSRGVLSPGRHVRTRLYFTSESHVHSLLSIFRYGGLLDVSVLPAKGL